ncbi:hypothetical protein JMJ55_21265 [Belnapia sp. T6]|uniref:Uncharacterized protein n=1 Tax=Belnapia mucosa TaxID=2804532 RepID=A0ABS1V867_9PROT|nr:hypothetical protein [Belnapia mucosa]MBL6457871.1 hypothetical protein [Belnapia mucosa]
MKRLILLAVLAAGPIGCSDRDPAASAPASGGAAMMARPPVPRGTPNSYVAPPANAAVRDQAALAAACRADADRIVTYRDRGQLMREDERDARIGTDASIYARRAETDRLGRIFERDRIAEDCVQQNTTTPPQAATPATPAAAAPAAAPPPNARTNTGASRRR